ncbi:MAG: hypothetical protein IK148_06295 [Prevotella sp.]|nr:hypothetical protein [Prevotella sp.]
MKKKKYLKPCMKILFTHSEQQLLAGSISESKTMRFDPYDGTDDAY